MKVPLVADAQVREGAVIEVEFFGRSVLLLRQQGHVRAFMNVCMHLGGPLQLAADGNTFECQWHHACFDAQSGKAVCGPARPDSRLMRLPIAVENGWVTYVYGESDLSAASTR
jgi:nitrite reductase/ring-hydroxylating ferredoxin subunit